MIFKIFANSWSSASNFKRFSRSLEEFSLTERQNKFRNKIPFPNFQRDNLNSTIVPTLIAIMYMTGDPEDKFCPAPSCPTPLALDRATVSCCHLV